MVRAFVPPLAAIAGTPLGGRRSHLLGISPDVGGAAADDLPSKWIGCRGGVCGASGGDGDAELRVPEICPDGIKDGEGDIPAEAELVDCGAMARCPWTRRMKATTTLGCGAWRVIDSLPADKSR
jgi:hypothetical protein